MDAPADEPPSSDLPAELQAALWGLPLARVGELRARLAGACIVCAAARRAEYNALAAVRAAAGQFAGMVRALAYSALPLPDVAAAASAWWGQQVGVRYDHAARADHVLAHAFHCGGDGWRLRLGLTECSHQAMAAIAAAGRHLAPPSGRPADAAARKLAGAIAEIAAAARAHVLAHAAAVAAPVDDVVLRGVPDVPVAALCLLCHGGAAADGDTAHARLAALYAHKFWGGDCPRAAEAAEAVAMGVCQEDRDKLGVERAALAACALQHYALHDASPAALLHKLRAALHGVALATLGAGVRLEGGTLVPDTRGMHARRRAEAAVVELQRAVAAHPGAARLCGMLPRGLRFVVA